LLAEVTTPTLVMHARDDARVPFDQGRRFAAGIRGARFVSLASRNHMILEDEPAFPRFLQEVRAFLAT
jgi:pimeloyl-ACP methyl ester carboxylesterase